MPPIVFVCSLTEAQIIRPPRRSVFGETIPIRRWCRRTRLVQRWADA